mgnify:FL=1
MEEHNEYSAEEASPEEIEGEGSSLDDETYSRVLAEDILNTEWAMTPDEEYSFQVTGTEDRMEFVLFESGNPENVCYRGYSKIISATETCYLYITFGGGEAEEVAVIWYSREAIDYPSLEAINSVFEEYAGDYHFSKNVN